MTPSFSLKSAGALPINKVALALVLAVLNFAFLPFLVNSPVGLYDHFTKSTRLFPVLSPCFAADEDLTHRTANADGSPSPCVVNAFNAVPNTVLKAALLQNIWEVSASRTPAMTLAARESWSQLARSSVHGVEYGQDWAVFVYANIPVLGGLYSSPTYRQAVDNLRSRSFFLPQSQGV